ncbi:hypothetical protein Scep_017151 [Stephania cephalantha]|uniref:Uncharacterized protein n=1 Tax=Stephania cephalantha TaxID=152367 RepID=A0AAP0IQD1_9MAGN
MADVQSTVEEGNGGHPRMHLICNGAIEYGQLGTRLSWGRRTITLEYGEHHKGRSQIIQPNCRPPKLEGDQPTASGRKATGWVVSLRIWATVTPLKLSFEVPSWDFGWRGIVAVDM